MSASDVADGDSVLPTENLTTGQRIAGVVTFLGVDTAVNASGKSEKQLMRYCSGAEPPFGAIHGLANASGVSLKWLATGEIQNEVEMKITTDGLKKEAKRFKTALNNDVSDEQKTEMETKLVEINIQLSGANSSILNAEIAQQIVPDEPTNSVEDHVATKIAKLIIESRKAETSTLEIATEVAHLTMQIMKKADNPTDLSELDSLLPWLENRIRKSQED